jgi:hypothetical protein
MGMNYDWTKDPHTGFAALTLRPQAQPERALVEALTPGPGECLIVVPKEDRAGTVVVRRVAVQHAPAAKPELAADAVAVPGAAARDELDGMDLDDLTTRAVELGMDVPPTITRGSLMQMIRAKLAPPEPPVSPK